MVKMVYSNENINETTMSSDDVILWIYNEFKQRRKEYDFTVNATLFREFDEYKDKTYSIEIKHKKAIKVGNFLLTIGTGSCTEMDEIGNCLEIIPVPKGKSAECFIENIKDFNPEKYAVIFSNKGKLCVPKFYIPKPTDTAMNIAIKPLNSAVKRYDKYNDMKLYPSAIGRYDEGFLISLLAVFEFNLGLNNKRTKKIKEEVANAKSQPTFNIGEYSDIQRKLVGMRDQISVRIELFGEVEYRPIYIDLHSAIRQLKEISFD